MANDVELLVLPFDPQDPKELSQFLGGMFLALLKEAWATDQAHFDAAAVNKGLSVPRNERALDEAALNAAFDNVAKNFPEPIRSRLQNQRADFIAAVYARN